MVLALQFLYYVLTNNSTFLCMKKIVAKNPIIIEILMQFLFYLYNVVMLYDDIHELTTQIFERTVFYSQNYCVIVR